MPRSISIYNAHRQLQLDRAALRRAIQVLDDAAEDFRGGAPKGDLSLAFLTDAALAELHGQFLADPTTTDVITFEGDAAFGTAGEICVSVDTAARFARDHGGEFSRELTLYVVHGWLHLAGYDDLVPAKKRVMRQAESRAMKRLDVAGVTGIFRFRPKTPRSRP